MSRFIITIICCIVGVSTVYAQERTSRPFRDGSVYGAVDANNITNLKRRPHWVANEILFKLRDDAVKEITADQRISATSIQEKKERLLQRKDRITQRHRLSSSRQLFSRSPEARQAIRHYRSSVPADKSVEEMVKELRTDPDVEWAEPNYYYSSQAYPNDPEYFESNQEYLLSLNLENAWDIHTGDPEVVVAIIDTGVNYNHEDLNDNIWINHGEIANDGIDNDGNGYIDDDIGWDFVSVPASDVVAGEDPGPPDNDPMDFLGHGTHVAGIVGAEGNNGIGVTGVAWDTSLMILRAGFSSNIASNGLLQTSAIAEALFYACDNGADIVNMSFGSEYASRAVREAIEYCADRGVFLVAAAGNNNSTAPFYPAAYDDVFAVANIHLNNSNRKDGPSNHGLWVDISAPGVEILSTSVDGSYVRLTGTSMAAPIVSGIAALHKSIQPGLSNIDLAKHIESTAQDISAFEPLYTGLGAGLIQADIEIATGNLPTNIKIVSLFIDKQGNKHDASLDTGDTVSILPTVRNFSGTEKDVTLTLSSTDQYLNIIQDTISMSSIMRNRWATPKDDAFILDISGDVPSNHNAEYTITIRSDGNTVSTSSHELKLNPYLRNEFLISDPEIEAQFFEPQLFNLPDNRVLLVYQSNIQLVEAQLFYRVREADLSWGPIKNINQIDKIQNALSGDVAQDGKVHIAYRQEFDNGMEIMHAVFDPDTDQWNNNKITDGADFIREEFIGILRPIIRLDQNDNPIVAWVDYRDGTDDIYIKRFNADQWLPDEKIFTLNLAITDMGLLIDADNELLLTWKGNNSEGLGWLDLYYSNEQNSNWTVPTKLASGVGNSEYSRLEQLSDENNIIYYFIGEDNGTPDYKSYIARFDGSIWTKKIFEENPGTGILTLNSSGIPEFYGFYLGLSVSLVRYIDDGTKWIIDGVVTDDPRVFDESSSSLLFMPSGEFILVTVDHDFSFNTMPLFILSSTKQENQNPEEPAITTTRRDRGFILDAEFNSSDLEDIKGYRVALGTAPGLDNISPWFNGSSDGCQFTFCLDITGPILDTMTNTITLDVSDRGPLLGDQTYYLSAQALNNQGYWSPIGTTFDKFIDLDLDFIDDAIDNCPTLTNTNQTDNDNDNIGDRCDTDDDNDGLSDVYEAANGLDQLNASDANQDLDGDGLTNLEEFLLGTAANKQDSDGDGINDMEEIDMGRNPVVNEAAVLLIINSLSD